MMKNSVAAKHRARAQTFKGNLFVANIQGQLVCHEAIEDGLQGPKTYATTDDAAPPSRGGRPQFPLRTHKVFVIKMFGWVGCAERPAQRLVDVAVRSRAVVVVVAVVIFIPICRSTGTAPIHRLCAMALLASVLANGMGNASQWDIVLGGASTHLCS
jgi:hypothetical protein